MNHADFAGTLYRLDSPHAARVRVLFAAEGVVARSQDGSEHHIPFAACELERGGLNGRVWTCRTPDRGLTLLVEDPRFPSALRERAPVDLIAAIDRILLSRARAERKSRVHWIVAVGLVCAFIAGTYYAVRTAGAAAVDVLPNSVDARVGEQSFARIKAQSIVVEDPVLSAALNHTLERLTSSGPAPSAFTYQVHLFDDPSSNAFALPGGHLVVHTGLIRAAQSAEQLAGVLAHEIAHVERRHGMRRVARSLGVVAAFELVLGDVSGLARVAVEVLRAGAINSYSREQEQQADLDAVGTLKRARIDPSGLADFLQLLRQREPGLPSELSWLGTHPDLGQRVADIRSATGDLRREHWEPLALDWAELQRRLPEVSRAAAGSETRETPASPLLAAD